MDATLEELIRTLHSFVCQRDRYVSQHGERRASVTIKRIISVRIDDFVDANGLSIGRIEGTYTRSERYSARIRSKQNVKNIMRQQVFDFVNPILTSAPADLKALRGKLSPGIERVLCEALYGFTRENGGTVNRAVHICWGKSDCAALTGKNLGEN